jgi:hypothetical protein
MTADRVALIDWDESHVDVADLDLVLPPQRRHPRRLTAVPSTHRSSGVLTVVLALLLIAACTADETVGDTAAPGSSAAAPPTTAAPTTPAPAPPSSEGSPKPAPTIPESTQPQPVGTMPPDDVATRAASIVRDPTQIVLEREETMTDFAAPWELDYYVDNAYECGLSGNHSFLVLDPIGNPEAEAPLWVYLHGGGVGYWDDQGTYHAVRKQTEDTWNHQETFEDFMRLLEDRALDGNGEVEDQTLARRIQEGYRLLLVSMCDHDLYLGLGTPYPNHPTNPNAEVNGLQATMAAIDYTAANYATTHVWAHGTSAGGSGVWGIASSYAQEGTALTGAIADSNIISPNWGTVADVYGPQDLMPLQPTFEPEGATEKIGFFADPNIPSFPEAQIADRDFRDVPVLFIQGDVDPYCAGHVAPIPEAAALGLSNCGYAYDGVGQAIANQVDSPHELHLLPATGHVPTNNPGPANDIVNDFIDTILATNPPNFGAE